MLASVLKSEKAILVNIRIIRIFSQLREILFTNKDIVEKLIQIEHKLFDHADNIQLIFKYLKQFEQTKMVVTWLSWPNGVGEKLVDSANDPTHVF